jgi:SAM-dependent methyltransferase
MDYFAVSDNREVKARKIDAVIADYSRTEGVWGKRILDLGCGSGHIARFFSRSNDVVTADVVDQRTIEDRQSLPFTKLEGPVLPFEAGSFDIVLLNHVIYCMPDPLAELKEVHRVLKQDGICYLASANRYFPVEGFTKLLFLHYLPHRLFQRFYKRVFRTGADLFPLGYHAIVDRIRTAGFQYREYTVEIAKHAGKYHGEFSVPSWLPVPACLSPTVIFILRK